ncbi:interferon-related developmental regulator-domain-containing protein [Aspergillus ambiguus]|uniref:IFRD domain-containing protein n=1 Tax=Aspergillus ambiguus TaxID=176160 RepID=UPI003CCD8B95
MPDLRRQVLESGKTISRKAASREGSRRTSRTNSAQNSRHSSRNASRQASDDEDAGSLSDDTAMSIGSLDDLTDNPDIDNNNWTQELTDVIQDILDRKRSSVLSREESYAAFCRLAKGHYIEEQLRRSMGELMAAFCRSVRQEPSVRETTLALRALELLAITVFDDTIYDNVEPVLTRAIRDSTEPLVKAAAIHALGACSIFGGAGEDAIQDQMTFFLDIAASDGQSIDAGDDAASVTAALQEWGVLAVEIEDLEGESEDAVQIFMDQLDSGDAAVQIAAGENIALLYEKSYTPQEEDESSDEDAAAAPAAAHSDSDDDDAPADGPRLIKRYNAYHNTHELEQQLQALATVHTKRISKRDRKSLHSNFASILTTVENPRRGPMYNTAIDQDTNRRYGSKLTVKIGRQGVMNIDRWWKWIRLNSLRRILQGGFAEHYYQGNRAVLDSLPVMVRQETGASSDRSAARKAAKTRNSRRWAVHDHSDDEM